MWTVTKYSLVLLVTVLACPANALPAETDGKGNPQPQTADKKGGKQPDTLKPAAQQFLDIVMWLDGDVAYTVVKFLNPLLCSNKHLIEWDKMKISFNFSVLVTMDDEGNLFCAISESICEFSLLYFCVQKQITDSKTFLNFYCCHMNDSSPCSTKTCSEQLKIPLNMDKLDKCMNCLTMEKEFAGIWSGKGMQKFTDHTKFPAFVVNGEFHEKTTVAMYKKFFSTTCEMYQEGFKPAYCPCNY